MVKNIIKPFMMIFNTQGMDEKNGVFFSKPSRAEYIENMHTNSLGTFSAHQQGYTLFSQNLFSNQRIDGLAYYQALNSQQFIIAAGGGQVAQLDLSGNVLASISTALLPNRPVDFEVFQSNLFACQKGSSSLKWTGSGTMLPLSGFPITVGALTYDKPSLLERHVNRLVYADFNGTVSYPSHIAISDDLAPETFTIGLNDSDAAVVQVSPGDGQNITGMKSLHLPSTNKTVLLIFKESSVYVLNGDTPTTFSINLVNATVGALNNRCIVQIGNDVIFMDRHRISSLSTVNESGTLRFKPIESDRIQKSLRELNLHAADQCFAVHLPGRQEVWFGIPTGSSPVVNKILVYHYSLNSDDPQAWSIRTGLQTTCPLLTSDDVFLMGDYSSNILRFFTNNTYDTQAIPWRYRYPFYNFDNQLVNKRVVECFAWFLNPVPMDITFKTEWRGGGSGTKRNFTKTVSPKNGATYGVTTPPAAIFGQSYYNDIPLTKVRIPVWGNGEQIRFELSGQTSSAGGPIFLGLTGLVEFMDDSRSYQ